MKKQKHQYKSNYQKSQDHKNQALQIPTPPKFFYHGTDEASAVNSLREGLTPRRDRIGNWENIPSNSDVIYLTDCYAPFFGATTIKKKGGRMAIVEIMASSEILENLMPDEDYLEQSTRVIQFAEKKVMFERTAMYRKKMFQLSHLWPDSLKGLGTVAHEGPISRQYITRIALVDLVLQPAIQCLAESLKLSMFAHPQQVLRAANLTRWCLGEDIPGWQLFGNLLPPNRDLAHKDQALLSSRVGVEIITNQHGMAA